MSDDYVDPIFDRPDPANTPPATPRSPDSTAAGAATPGGPSADQTADRQPTARRPTDDVEDREPFVAAQKPTENVEPRVAARSATQRQPRADDLVCTKCAHSNARDRTFCERCGTMLASTTVATPADVLDRTWWQRFTRWLRRLGRRGGRDQARSAGRGARVAYRRTLSVKNQAMRVLGLVGLVGGGLFVADVGPFGDIRASVLDRITAETVELRPDSITALPPGTEVALWPPREISDGRDNTAWGVTWGGESTATPCGVESQAASRLRLTFPRSSLERIDLMLGLPGTNFENTARPSQLGLVFSSSSECRVVDLEDTHDEQSIPVDVDGAESVEIWVLSVVADEADNPGLALISELELFATD